MNRAQLESWRDSTDRPGTLSGRWTVDYEAILGGGAHSEWFEGEDLTLGDAEADRPLRVAVQLIRPNAPEEVIERLAAAGWLTAVVAHPRVIRTLDRGRVETADGDLYWSVSELVSHPTLEEWVQEAEAGGAPAALALVWLIASTLAEIRAKFFPEAAGQALHRDLAPRNIFIVCDRLADGAFGPIRDILIGDWTFALTPRAPEATEIRTAAISVGTPRYRAPEVAMKQPPTDMSDVYSMGALAYLVLTCVEPEDARPPTGLPIDVPKDVGRFFLAMLAPQPEDRPGYARTSLGEATSARAAEAVVATRARELLDRLAGGAPTTSARGAWAWTAALLLVGAIAAAGWFVTQHPERAPALARLLGIDAAGAAPPAAGPPTEAARDDRDAPLVGDVTPKPVLRPLASPASESAKLYEGVFDGLYDRERGSTRNFDFAGLIHELRARGLDPLADSMLAAHEAGARAHRAWSAGEASPAARFEQGEFVKVAGVKGNTLFGLTSSGTNTSIEMGALDAGPVFAELRAEDRVHGLWASRGAMAAATTAAEEGTRVDEGWWLVAGAFAEAREDLERMEKYAFDEITRERPKPETPIAPPLPGHDPVPPKRRLRIDLPAGAIEDRLARVTRLVTALDGWEWWGEIARLDADLEVQRLRLAREIEAWSYFADRQDVKLAQEASTTAAFRAAVERLARERGWLAWNVLEGDNVKRWVYSPEDLDLGPAGIAGAVPSIERKPRGEGDEALVHAAAGAIELAPADWERRGAVEYVRVRAALKRMHDTGSLWFLLGPNAEGERIEVRADGDGRGEVGLWSAGAPTAEIADVFNPDRVIEHTFELVAVGKTAVLRVDGKIAYVTPWKNFGTAWPRVGFMLVDGVVLEIREWDEIPEEEP